MAKLKLVFFLFISLLSSCSNKELQSPTENIEPLIMLQKDHLGFIDGRSRFRDIFCTILEGGDYPLCEEPLPVVGEESTHTSGSVNLKPSNKNFIVGLVPGIAWQCVRNWLNNDNSGPEHALKHGYDVRLFAVDGLSSTINNAQQIKQHVDALPEADKERPVILIGYSKGAADTLYAVSKIS